MSNIITLQPMSRAVAISCRWRGVLSGVLHQYDVAIYSPAAFYLSCHFCILSIDERLMPSSREPIAGTVDDYDCLPRRRI